jgi:hypothetical protein
MKEKYEDFDSYEYHFVDEVLKDIFGKKNMIRRYSLGAEGTFNLLYIDNSIYEFRFKKIKFLPKSDGKKAFRDSKKDEVIEAIANRLNENNIEFSITKGKFVSLKDNSFITQIEIVKKTKEPENLGKVRIDGEWI